MNERDQRGKAGAAAVEHPHETPTTSTEDPEALARRAFIKKVGMAGATAPAAMLLLSASNKGASAQVYGACTASCSITITIACGCISDFRLKRDITLLSRLVNGLGLYRYRYLWSDIEYVGVMAQEVEKVMPRAVVCGADGYLRVDYQRLGLRLVTWREWAESAEMPYAVPA